MDTFSVMRGARRGKIYGNWDLPIFFSGKIWIWVTGTWNHKQEYVTQIWAQFRLGTVFDNSLTSRSWNPAWARICQCI